jgi:hypothetical protein
MQKHPFWKRKRTHPPYYYLPSKSLKRSYFKRGVKYEDGEVHMHTQKP